MFFMLINCFLVLKIVYFLSSKTNMASLFSYVLVVRQLTDWKVETAHMNGFLSYLRKEMMEKITKEEPHLHVYSSDDVEM